MAKGGVEWSRSCPDWMTSPRGWGVWASESQLPSTFNFPGLPHHNNLAVAPTKRIHRYLTPIASPDPTPSIIPLRSVSAAFRSFRVCLQDPLRRSETIVQAPSLHRAKYPSCRKTTSNTAVTHMVRPRLGMASRTPTAAVVAMARPTRMAEV